VSTSGPFTLVSFHAHPDDEALLTGGTLARAAAEGHRVVLVVATAGEAGLTDRRHRAAGDLADRRMRELRASASLLGCHRLEVLGYADSGLEGTAIDGGPGQDPGGQETGPETGGQPFSRVDVEVAARRLADLLREEEADVLTVYDPAGGYGHPDHVQVHRVGVRAAELAGTPVVLEATADRDALRRVTGVLRRLPWLRTVVTTDTWDRAYTPRAQLTHAVDVRPYLAVKRAAMRAHASQAAADGGVRTLALLTRLPRPLLSLAVGRERFVERGRAPGPVLLDDAFASLRSSAGRGGRA
jgi:LmbE family N-acetylglucosaminyl deacetylase